MYHGELAGRIEPFFVVRLRSYTAVSMQHNFFFHDVFLILYSSTLFA